MTSEERRHKDRLLVSEYRARLRDLESAQQDGVAGRDLQRRLQEAESLYSRCDLPGPQVAEVDGRLVAELCGELLRGVRGFGAGTFQPADFAVRLAAAVGEDESPSPRAWAGLGRLTAPVLPACPGLHLVLGSLEAPNAPPPERRPRAPRQRAAPLAAAVAPDKVVEAAGATPQQINRLEAVLNKLHSRVQRPIGFFEFAYDPDEFGVTMENVFHTSILVKMRKARVFLKNGLPVIEPTAADAAGAPASDERHQVLHKVDPATWRRVVQEFGIKKRLIPRPESAQRTDGAR